MSRCSLQEGEAASALSISNYLIIYDYLKCPTCHIWIVIMGSPKTKRALERLGSDIRTARLRRGIAVAELAVRAGTSASSVGRLEKGDRGVAIGTLADVLVALGLIERLADLVDVRKDDLGLALATEQLPRRGRTFATRLKMQRARSKEAEGEHDVIDPDGVAF
jgi:transcriptional regulator with XRE-family HTH domain